jgi:hypothetical protein
MQSDNAGPSSGFPYDAKKQHADYRGAAWGAGALSESETASLFSSPLERDYLRAFAGASSQSFFQICRMAMLFQQIIEGLIRKLLKCLHAF